MLLCCNMYVPSVYETTYSHIAARSRIRKHVFSGQRLVNEWPLECADSACWLKLNVQSQHVDWVNGMCRVSMLTHVNGMCRVSMLTHINGMCSQRFQIADSANEPYIIEIGLCVQIREIVHTPAVVIENFESTNWTSFAGLRALLRNYKATPGDQTLTPAIIHLKLTVSGICTHGGVSMWFCGVTFFLGPAMWKCVLCKCVEKQPKYNGRAYFFLF